MKGSYQKLIENFIAKQKKLYIVKEQNKLFMKKIEKKFNFGTIVLLKNNEFQ